MFFYLSGMVSTFFKTEEKSYFKFALDKVLRLIVPFIFGVIFFLIPKLYLA